MRPELEQAVNTLNQKALALLNNASSTDQRAMARLNQIKGCSLLRLVERIKQIRYLKSFKQEWKYFLQLNLA